VKAITGCIEADCTGRQRNRRPERRPNGGITYYASVIYAAQAALTAEATLNAKTNNALIFLSDGQATW